MQYGQSKKKKNDEITYSILFKLFNNDIFMKF